MPRPTRDRYTAIVVNPDPHAEGSVEHTVEITPADQLRAELEGHKQGLGPMKEAPLHYTVMWIWCALTRTHLYAEDWQTFVQRDLYAYGSAEDDDDKAGEGDPDPTPASGPLEFG
jgi:hypothetical protein